MLLCVVCHHVHVDTTPLRTTIHTLMQLHTHTLMQLHTAGEDLPVNLLRSLYDSIRRNEIKIYNAGDNTDVSPVFWYVLMSLCCVCTPCLCINIPLFAHHPTCLPLFGHHPTCPPYCTQSPPQKPHPLHPPQKKHIHPTPTPPGRSSSSAAASPGVRCSPTTTPTTMQRHQGWTGTCFPSCGVPPWLRCRWCWITHMTPWWYGRHSRGSS